MCESSKDGRAREHAMADAIAAYEAVFGAITDEEQAAQERADRLKARVIRARPQD